MISMEQIEDFTKRVVNEFQPMRVLLFGSYARGEQTADSDVDLLIIMSFTGKPAAKSAEIRLRLRPTFPVDLIVRTPDSVEMRLAMGERESRARKNPDFDEIYFHARSVIRNAFGL
jgi:predicted nucleotidyltransferase